MLLKDKMIDNTEDNNIVFHKIRISNPNVDTDGKIRHLMNGISANSWLTPIGITQKSEKAPYGPINDEIKTVIQERAFSAGAVLGRRHFEIEKQEVKKNEVLYGHRVNFTPSGEIKTEHKIEHGGRFCGRKCISNYLEYRNKYLTSRPNTCFASLRSQHTPDVGSLNVQAEQIGTTSRPHTSHGAMETKRTPDIETLNVQAEQVCMKDRPSTSNGSLEIKSELDIENGKSEQTFNQKCNSNKAPEETSPFKSFSEMKIAYRDRVKSAPALLTKPIPQDIQITQDKTKPKSVPVYWRARTVYHRRQMANCGGEEFEDNFVYFTKGSLLRPLMHSESTALKHSAGCPYKCKGCFRACLVSQDYYEKVKDQKRKRPKPKLIRPSFYHRRIIELALAKLQPINKLIQNEQSEKSKGQDSSPVESKDNS